MSKTTNISKRGFTIVELLIVIVVIAILAAISIVAYNGIQNRGKASAAQSLGAQVQKKVEIYNTVTSAYPTYAELTAATSAVKEAQLDNPAVVTTTVPTNESTVRYVKCAPAATGGAQVTWYSATAAAPVIIGIGGASSTTACTSV